MNFKDKPDGELLAQFVIPGPPRTKKNSPIIVNRGRPRPVLLPSKQFKEFEAHCKDYCKEVWEGNDPIDYGVAIRVEVTLEKHIYPDHVGILQSLGDIFQTWKIVDDDKWIVWTDYAYEEEKVKPWLIGKDKDNPHTVVTIYRLRTALEEYQDSKNK
jgi:hypothetical protein